MKTLFLVFYGFQEYNGISKKIRYQADALRLCGADVRTCHYEVGNDGSRKWMIDEDVLADLGKGIPAKNKKTAVVRPYPAIRSPGRHTMRIYPLLSQRQSLYHTLREDAEKAGCKSAAGDTHISL